MRSQSRTPSPVLKPVPVLLPQNARRDHNVDLDKLGQRANCVRGRAGLLPPRRIRPSRLHRASIRAPPGNYRQIVGGKNFACGIESNGFIECWGNNFSGQSRPSSNEFERLVEGYWGTQVQKTDGTWSFWGGYQDYLGYKMRPQLGSVAK